MLAVVSVSEQRLLAVRGGLGCGCVGYGCGSSVWG